MFQCDVLPFIYLRGLQAPLPDTLKETSVRVPNLAENCVPESDVPSDRSVPNLAANPEPEPSAAALLHSHNAANTLNIRIFGRGLATNSVSS